MLRATRSSAALQHYSYVGHCFVHGENYRVGWRGLSQAWCRYEGRLSVGVLRFLQEFCGSLVQLQGKPTMRALASLVQPRASCSRIRHPVWQFEGFGKVGLRGWEGYCAAPTQWAVSRWFLWVQRVRHPVCITLLVRCVCDVCNVCRCLHQPGAVAAASEEAKSGWGVSQAAHRPTPLVLTGPMWTGPLHDTGVQH